MSMTIAGCRKHLWDLKFTTGSNQRYHHCLEWWWGAIDKTVRIAVGVIAVLGFWTAFPNAATASAAFWIGLIGVVIALFLNVIPLGDREKFHGEMFRRWSDLRAESEVLEVKIGDKEASDSAGQAITERVLELIARENQLHADEPAPYRWLLQKCEGDENESLHGPGLRTYAQIEAERAKRAEAWAAISLPEEADLGH